MSEDIQKYKMLDEITHVLERSGMYLGSTVNTEKTCFLPKEGEMVEETITYNPALLKMLDEVVSNSVDEHRRTGKVTELRVDVGYMTGDITVYDNGGIPVQKHPEYNMYIPSMIFGELRTGSNFDDSSRLGAGMNGLGAKLTSIFSDSFKVETADGKKKFVQVFEKNLSVKNPPSVLNGKDNFTRISFMPDYSRLNCTMDEDNFRRIEKRVYDIAGCNPKLKVFFNDELIKVNKFKDYVEMFVDEAVEDSNPDWEIAVGASKNDEFKHVSFVNGVDTFNGGTHIDYIANQISSKLRDHIKKKHKIDVKPNNIKQQLFLFINCTVNAPVFTSQTKEFMGSDTKDYGTEFVVDDKFIAKLLKSEIVQRILDWAEAQQRQKELAELRKMNKQTQNTNFLKKIVKFDDATTTKRQEATLYIVEGDSAAKAILSARDPKSHGVYPLKGKPLNVRDVKVSKLTANDEFANLMAIIGLKLGHDVKPEDLRFGKIVVATDADPDGQHILGLVLNMFQQFWPNLIVEKAIYKLKTPQILATKKKGYEEFFSRAEYTSWQQKGIKHSMDYYKGLGSWSSKDFARFLNDGKYLEPMTADDSDFDCIDLAFDKKRSDDRKEWLLGA